MPAADATQRGLRIEKVLVLAVALAFIGLIALRSTFGVSFYDDSHYVTVCLRMSQGARPFADEMSVQSLGFLPATAFVWLWTHLFGMTGLVTAFRLSYVAAASAVGCVAYAQLRRTFHPLVAALAIALPLACPPFNLFAPGYNQMTTLGFVLATALAHRAWLDRDAWASAGAGVALVFASVTYPPLVVAAFVMVVALIAVTRDRRVIVPLLAACAIASAVFVGGLLSVVSIAEIRHGLGYATANVAGFASPMDKVTRAFTRLGDALNQPILWPMWIVAAFACVRRFPDRFRALLLLALPVLASLRGIQALTSGLHVFGLTAGAWLITFTAAASIPVALWAFHTRHERLIALLAIALPTSAIGFMTVAYSTDSPWLRGVAVIGILPAAIAVIASWSAALEELWGESLLVVAATFCVVLVLGMLWSESIDNGPPLAMSGYIDHGAYAGMHMSPDREQQIRELEAAGKRWVRPGDRVTFYGERQGYLATGGRIFTNAVWLYPSPSDSYALEYFAKQGALPDVVFADQFGLRMRGMLPFERLADTDPLVARLVADYRYVDNVADFGIWVRKNR